MKCQECGKGFSEEDWKVTEKRLMSMPDSFSIGFNCKSFNKDELIIEVKNKTEFGEIYVDMQIGFIKWLLKEAIGSHKTVEVNKSE